MVRTLPTAKDMVSSEDKQGLVSPQQGLLSLPVLVLNLNYVPINICTGRRAIVLVEKEKAGFAFPSHSLYVESYPKEKTEIFSPPNDAK